ncbi:MAG: hypothetical protein D8H97_06650 [Neisseria sp.]|nr:MAG: hypothetical protein D8H97_06650 [Neisseria sp.]
MSPTSYHAAPPRVRKRNYTVSHLPRQAVFKNYLPPPVFAEPPPSGEQRDSQPFSFRKQAAEIHPRPSESPFQTAYLL